MNEQIGAKAYQKDRNKHSHNECNLFSRRRLKHNGLWVARYQLRMVLSASRICVPNKDSLGPPGAKPKTTAQLIWDPGWASLVVSACETNPDSATSISCLPITLVCVVMPASHRVYHRPSRPFHDQVPDSTALPEPALFRGRRFGGRGRRAPRRSSRRVPAASLESRAGPARSGRPSVLPEA